ncbi:MAG: hypothetical protein WCK51_06675 [Armatimonadota bacterium]
MTEVTGKRIVGLAGKSALVGNLLIALASLVVIKNDSMPLWVFYPGSFLPLTFACLLLLCLLVYSELRKFREMYALAVKWTAAFILVSAVEIWLGYSLLNGLRH